MIGHIKTSWRIFASGRPGLRFRERYRLRQSQALEGVASSTRAPVAPRGAPRSSSSALLRMAARPGLGDGFRARVDRRRVLPGRPPDGPGRGEARILFGPLGKKLARLPASAQLSASLTVALATFAVVYGLFSITRRLGPPYRAPQPGGVPSTGVLSLTDQPPENWAEHTTP